MCFRKDLRSIWLPSTVVMLPTLWSTPQSLEQSGLSKEPLSQEMKGPLSKGPFVM
jgi:hypothetical protein